MQRIKDLMEEKREELPQYKIDACTNQVRHRLRKVIEVAGKHLISLVLLFYAKCVIVDLS